MEKPGCQIYFTIAESEDLKKRNNDGERQSTAVR